MCSLVGVTASCGMYHICYLQYSTGIVYSLWRATAVALYGQVFFSVVCIAFCVTCFSMEKQGKRKLCFALFLLKPPILMLFVPLARTLTLPPRPPEKMLRIAKALSLLPPTHTAAALVFATRTFSGRPFLFVVNFGSRLSLPPPEFPWPRRRRLTRKTRRLPLTL